MNTIVVEREKLLETLQKNRDNHRTIFEEALEGYRKSVIQTLEEQLTRAKQGKRIEATIRFPQPEDHTKDYDRVIQMLTWTTEDEVQLSEHDFAQYVQDDWGWQQQFLTSNQMYSGIAQRKLEEQMPMMGS